MALTKAEKEFVEKNRPAFMRALTAAAKSTRANSKLTGCDRLRDPIAFHAALLALGFLRGPFTPPKAAGPLTSEMLEIVKAEIEVATAAAKSTRQEL